MTLSVNSTAKASDNSHLDIGHGTDNAPRSQLVFIAYRILCDHLFAIARLGFCRYDTRPEQALTVQRRTEFARHLLVGGKRDNLCKTLSKAGNSSQLTVLCSGLPVVCSFVVSPHYKLHIVLMSSSLYKE
jgi:hypothetical protein